jgi:hypothetical protein
LLGENNRRTEDKDYNCEAAVHLISRGRIRAPLAGWQIRSAIELQIWCIDFPMSFRVKDDQIIPINLLDL